ncbi:right-handed parallel beta-helix repeat-containing protein, partial [Paraglaciecola sp.]|uniref:right-handed parallel beta-helix repeat-containing protein n=1 Tax=Paraglaciecola sp. TaxID=1920173 RepID=UPI00273ECA53
MTQLSKIMGLSKNCIVVCIIFSLVSCAQFDTPKRMAIKGQPGDYFVEQIKEQHLSSLKEIVALLQHPDFKKQKAKTYLTKEVQDTAILLKEISFSESTSQAIIQLSKTKPDKTEKWVAIGLQLYPIDAYRIIEQLYADSTIQESALESAALTAGLDPDRLLPATASGDLEYRIVPLINSASLTVYNQTEGAETRLWFKSSDSDKWLPALSLQWEPIMGALSGSIVRLQADTAYDIKLEYLDDSDVTEERLYSFKTRPNSPPIDPEKIYYLSDIYTGGQLNLTTLGIEGSETGWALIKGDGVEIIAGTEDESAIDIGSQSFIKFENIHVIGGKKYGVKSKNAHHIWIKGCDISQYGRVGEDMRDGVAYDTSESTTPINYDSGIYLTNTGVVTIEDCEIHDPNGKANNWGYGHPNGPNAMLLSAYHPDEEYRGQYIIRNNRFYGTAEHRFNDVIESRSNGRIWGGFVRDSAIHNNYLAYANDDIIELDGGQSNVLFYNNEIEQGYCGVSAIPNMLGPSYIFNNFIHNLGDERQKSWAAIKLGGLISAPAGLVNIFENLIVTSSNGIASAGFKSDSTFWT